MNTGRTEPVTLVGSLELAAVGIATALVLGMGEDITSQLGVAIVAAVAATARLLGIILTRAGVWSPASHDAAVDEALRTPPPEA
jgi:hypothetical protein